MKSVYLIWDVVCSECYRRLFIIKKKLAFYIFMASVAQPTSFNIEYWRHSDCVRQAELKPIVARRLQCTGPILTTIVLELLAFRPRWLKVSLTEKWYIFDEYHVSQVFGQSLFHFCPSGPAERVFYWSLLLTKMMAGLATRLTCFLKNARMPTLNETDRITCN